MSATIHQAFTTSTLPGVSPLEPSETHQESSLAAARLVPISKRPDFIANLFGPRMFIAGESAIFGWMRRLCDAYDGGSWDFYTVGIEGAGFMAPRMPGPLTLSVETNGCHGQMSAEAAGVVVTLFALNHLMYSASGDQALDLLVRRYDALRDYASGHAEQREIFRAID